MSHKLPDVLVEERVAQLAVISKRRNELLTEMYHLLRRRDNIGAVYMVQEGGDDLQGFLQKYDINKNPDTGSINHLPGLDIAYFVSPSQPTFEPSASAAEYIDDVYQGSSPEPWTMEDTSMEGNNVVHTAAQRSGDRSPTESEDELNIVGPSRPHSSGQVIPHRPSIPVYVASMENTNVSIVDIVPDERDLDETDTSLPPITEEAIGEDILMQDVEEPAIIEVQAFSDVVQPFPQHHTAIANLKKEEEEEEEEKEEEEEEEEKEVIVQDHIVTSTGVTPSRPAGPVNPQQVLFVNRQATLETQHHGATMKTEPLILAQPSIASEFRHISPQQLLQSSLRILPSVRPVYIPTPTESFQGLPQYNFDLGSPTQTSPPTPVSSPKPHLQFDPQYTLPPIKTLPAEFSRRGKLSKQIPMGLNRWGFTINANSLWKKVSKATKCLTTRDWSIAMAELRLARTIDRIETLKDAGKWSFRQPKKQRSVDTIPKTHWDYIGPEMDAN